MSLGFIDEDKRRKRKNPGAIWNVLALLIFILTLCMLSGFLLVFINPYVPFNPFPPPTIPPTLAWPTPSPTLPIVTLPPTWTPTPTLTPSPTITPSPTVTPSPTPTPAFSPTPYPFELQPGTPTYTTSKVFHTEANCNWLSVAGQVLDTSGQPIVVNVVVRGVLDNQQIDRTTISGTATNFGPGGYEIQLADHPIASTHTLYIQLLDPNGLPISPPVYFDTQNSCDQNITLINFRRRP